MAILNDIPVNFILLFLNAASCAITAYTLMTFQRNGAAHNFVVASFAWVLIVASASVTILVLCGEYKQASLSETAINIALCVTVVAARGNVAKLYWKKP